MAAQAFTVKGEGRAFPSTVVRPWLVLAVGGAGHDRRNAASARCSQNRMSISRYIVVAVVEVFAGLLALAVRRES